MTESGFPDSRTWMSIRPDIPISPAIAECLGRVIIAFGMLEKELLAAIAFLLSTHEQLARAALASLGFNARVDALFAVAWARWQDDAPMESVKETAKQLRAAAKRRKDYVHLLLLGTASAESPYTPGNMASYFGSQRGRPAFRLSVC